ncbi:hypothetical protein T12_2828 [Trichinella patagoniensis]|uniref:Uncharacterized protein n=1 Tax=Trichinella patagoniensis TaxID=990121 RepID=A0A0V0ZWV4_9BILA|nr:hypothetical protein T12_2828 [Trichinella patagoniensis]
MINQSMLMIKHPTHNLDRGLYKLHHDFCYLGNDVVDNLTGELYSESTTVHNLKSSESEL